MTEERLREIEDYAGYRKKHSESCRMALECTEEIRRRGKIIEEYETAFKEIHGVMNSASLKVVQHKVRLDKT
jgi:hypothetical protein